MTAFEAAKTAWTEFALAVDYPNRQTVDLENQELPYVDLGLDFFHGEQLGFKAGSQKVFRTDGIFKMMIGTKVNDGTRVADRLAQHFTDALQARRIGIVEVEAATGARIVERVGWRYSPLILPFWFTRITN